MGFIIDFIIKVTGFRKFFAISLFTLRFTFLVAWLAFYISVTVAIGKAYEGVSNVFDAVQNASFGGTVAGNDINAIVWSVLHALGVIDVLTTFLPIVFSTLVIYLSLYLVRILLSFQDRIYKSLVDAGIIFLG